MPKSTRPDEPLALMFGDDGSIPNNPHLPFLVYRGAMDVAGADSPERVIESTFSANGWGDMWRNGIFPYVHYHSKIHEALGIARGCAKVRFGGAAGEVLELEAGDVAVLPAGTGPPMPVGVARAVRHRRLSQARQLRSVPRQQGRACQGAQNHSGSAAAGQRSRAWQGRPADHALAGGAGCPIVRPPRREAGDVRDGRLDRLLGFQALDLCQRPPSRRALPHDRAGHPRAICRLAPPCSITAAARRCTPRSSPPSARTLILCEAAPKVRAALARRFAAHAKIKVCAPEELAALPAQSLDAVVLHSVTQYLAPDALDALLVTFRRVLTEQGILIVGDVIRRMFPRWEMRRRSFALPGKRLSRCNHRRSLAHAALRLLAAALATRAHALWRGGDDRKARQRRV